MKMETLWLWTLVVVYGLWFLLTLVRAAGYTALVRFRVPRPLWALLPNWSLFAPHPGMTDYYLFYRDQSGSEEPGPWILAHGPEPRKWYHGLWNPNKIQAKAVFDLMQQLEQATASMPAGGEEQVMKSAPYQHLLFFVRHLPRTEPKDHTQFSIVVQQPARQYELTFMQSPFYPI